MCLYVFGWFQSKRNAVGDTPKPAEGAQGTRAPTSSFALGPSDGKRKRQSRSEFLGHTLLTASQGSEGKRSLLMTGEGRALGVGTFTATPQNRGGAVLLSFHVRGQREQS